MNRFVLILALFFLSFTAEKAQEKTLSLIFVDNSKISTSDGLNSAMIDNMEAKLTELDQRAESNHFMLYASNGLEPKVAKSVEDARQVLATLNDSYFEFPMQQYDKDRIIAEFTKSDAQVGSLDLNFYVSYTYAEKFITDQPAVLGNLVSELTMKYGLEREDKVVINLHYPKAQNLPKNMQENLEESISILKFGLNVEINILEHN